MPNVVNSVLRVAIRTHSDIHSCYLFQVLSKATVGATAVGGDSEDATQQENSSDNASNQPIKSSDANNYVIVGTLSDPKGVKPEWVTELIMVILFLL